ncbi:sigma-70 family RNA polymerase sigma factor [Alicyclobacillus sp. SO9]|uniref:sigma-70 family RNA polymerase sigma factor n=1 Tax=Alicyclobacillus sp. SO9 TaxID=2665646 RepID=UPI0018E70913|nr:sigma-70 family RNA polymerase sigma factor [Alicyclobacillus sp. SO9]QQE78787.1 sigma-70 family RNA polymerase sigma factor [Alicyclobacillus sp. SO9]
MMEYTAEQEVAWCKKVIKNIGFTLLRKRQRLSRHELSLDTLQKAGVLPVITQSSPYDSELPFHSIEWLMLFEKLLSTDERCIVLNLFWSGFSQRETAKLCNLSQSSVTRSLHVALTKIRRAVFL